MLLGEVQATCLGLAEDVSQLSMPVCRIDGHEDKAGESRPDLEHDPVGAVRRPQRDPITGLKPLEERAGDRLTAALQLAVGPAPPLVRFGDSFDHATASRWRATAASSN